MLLNKLNVNAGIKVNPKTRELLEAVKGLGLNFIVPIALTLISLGIFAFYVRPTYESLPKLKEQLAKKANDVSVLEAKVVQLKSLEANKDLVLSDLVKMSWALEERDKVPELSQQVKLMCQDSGVGFISLDYANANRADSPVSQSTSPLSPDPNLYRDEKVNVTVGSKDLISLVKFLKASENSIRLFSVDSLRISNRMGTEDAVLVMSSPYLNPTFSTYSDTAAPINLNDQTYREFMQKLDTFKNYAQAIDATLPKI